MWRYTRNLTAIWIRVMSYRDTFRLNAMESVFTTCCITWNLFFCKFWVMDRLTVQFRGRGTALANQTGRATENIPLEEEMPASSLSYSWGHAPLQSCWCMDLAPSTYSDIGVCVCVCMCVYACDSVRKRETNCLEIRVTSPAINNVAVTFQSV